LLVTRVHAFGAMEDYSESAGRCQFRTRSPVSYSDGPFRSAWVKLCLLLHEGWPSRFGDWAFSRRSLERQHLLLHPQLRGRTRLERFRLHASGGIFHLPAHGPLSLEEHRNTGGIARSL